MTSQDVCQSSAIIIYLYVYILQGGELEILKSINWNHTVFDVLCIETEVANRPPNYAQTVTSYLADRGYVNATGQIGRNICESWDKISSSQKLSINRWIYMF